MPCEELTLRRCAGAIVLLAGLVGCANVLGLEERTARQDAGAALGDPDAAAAECSSNARTCLGPLQPRVCSPAGQWVDEAPCAAGSYECASQTATCVRCAAAPAELGAWRVAMPVVAASPRYLAMAAYDSTRSRVVLFGGLPTAQEDAALSDTWLWDGATWSGALPVTSPSRRFAGAMADDAGRGQIVLFGGEDYRFGLLADTWVWDGTSWLQRCGPGKGPCGPRPRAVHAMAYDSDRRRVVMFGGGRTLVEPTQVHVGSAMSETWEWDGATWTEICGETSTTPCAIPGLRGASMAYDPVRKRIALYGGAGDSVGADANPVDRVWEYDGATWSKREEITNVPPPRSFASMTYDTKRARVVLHGGLTGLGSERLSDTWEYDGNCWKDVTSANALPPPRSIFASSYDSARAELVVFGGDVTNLATDPSTDTTVLRPSPATSR